MRIAIGSDHAGYALKKRIRDTLRGRGHDVADVGCASEAACDYPDFAHAVARAVAGGSADRGVLVCGSGLGMSMAANRHRGVRAAAVSDVRSAALARSHNDANVVCVGARVVAPEHALDIVAAFLDTPYERNRHAGRVAKIDISADEA